MSIDNIRPRVSADNLYTITDPNIAERVILDLACLIHRRANTGSSAVSIKAQRLAHDVFNQVGLEECLKMLCEE